MAKLTPEDKESYKKLQEAFSKRKLVKQSTNPPEEVSEDGSLQKISSSIIESKATLSNTEHLHQKIDLFDIYLKVLLILEIELSFKPQIGKDIIDIEKLKQEFFGLLENLKRSLKAVEDENIDLTDKVENLNPDVLFIKFIELVDTSARETTEILSNNRNPNLNEKQINKLTQAWGTAVDTFVEDARKQKDPTKPDGQVEPGQSDTFAHFFRIHKELEILYGRLAKTEAVQFSR